MTAIEDRPGTGVPRRSGRSRRWTAATMTALALLLAGAAVPAAAPAPLHRFPDDFRVVTDGVPRAAGRDAPERVHQVLGHVQRAWARAFRRADHDFWPARLRLARDTERVCDTRVSGFDGLYCAWEGHLVVVNLDTYLRDLRHLGQADADAYMASVVAHELGHHVQHLLGGDGLRRAHRAKELEAECLSGVWFGAAGVDAVPYDLALDASADSAAREARRWFDRGRDAARPAACLAGWREDRRVALGGSGGS